MMLHPATVHFAIVLPLVASVFGVIYLFTKTESMAKISTRATVIAALAMIGVWYTGYQAGPLIYSYLSEAGKHELLEHKALGLYLAIAMGVIALLRVFGCKTKKFGIEALAIILLVAATATTFLQGKHGGEIVYEHGQPFEMQQLKEYLTNSDELEMADDVEGAVNMVKKKITAISETTSAKIQNLKTVEKDGDED
ncbi:hypothetical protein KKA17_01265 [bacterium]|nr:hypothetical protein [bacterium]MBU1882928.1 hypothetical protein [bacterium]